MTAPYFFIVNPVAGGGRGLAVWRVIQQEARRIELPYEYELTRAPFTGISFVRQALRAGARTIVAVGGDGTVLEAVNGFYLDGVPVNENATFSVIPAGRTGSFAKNLGIPAGLSALSLLTRGRQAAVDLAEASFTDSRGLAVTRFFANGARVGGEPMPMPQAPSFGPMGWTGALIVDDGDQLLVQARTVVVAIGPNVGGRLAAPRAKMDDGLLDVVIETPPSGLPADLAIAARGGDKSDAVGRHIKLEMDGSPPIELDGDSAGAGSIDVHIRPSALRVHVA